MKAGAVALATVLFVKLMTTGIFVSLIPPSLLEYPPVSKISDEFRVSMAGHTRGLVSTFRARQPKQALAEVSTSSNSRELYTSS